MDEKQENGTKYIPLQPFIHQVGGHSSMLCLDEATVCKPVVEREKIFYETLPENLKSFVPTYHGIVKVHLVPDGDYIVLSSTTPEHYSPKPSSLKRLRLRRTGSIEVNDVSDMFEPDPTNGGSAAMNPWVRKCLKEYILSITDRLDGDPLNFMVLENLTWRFRLPCILDLKMGTRQYSDNDTLAKRQSKMVKVVTTTSAKLGVRIGGMQVYQASSGRFLCRNKLYGRTLTASGFQSALQNFLHDGKRLRIDALPPLIRRLEELRNTLTCLESIRLYTTSLLLLYEGSFTEGSDCRYQDQDQSECSQHERDVEPKQRSERANSVDRQADLLSLPTDFRHRSCSCNPREKKQQVDKHDEEPLTDVRIIDFAHSTHPAMEDKVTYSGPDSGFLFGLNNMINLLKAILAESQ